MSKGVLSFRSNRHELSIIPAKLKASADFSALASGLQFGPAEAEARILVVRDGAIEAVTQAGAVQRGDRLSPGENASLRLLQGHQVGVERMGQGAVRIFGIADVKVLKTPEGVFTFVHSGVARGHAVVVEEL